MTDVGSLSSGPLFGLPLPTLWFVLLFFIFGMFLFLDGFDFGIGALFAVADDEHEKEQLLATIAPFWDGNEVWLVVFGGALFAAFPTAYANVFSRYYLLMFAILGALGLRGLAPEMYEQREDDRWRRLWGWSFVVGSVATPFLLGLFVANWLLGTVALVTPTGITLGLAVVTLTVVDGAAFLSLKTGAELGTNVRTYGVRAAMSYLGLVLLSLGYAYVTEPSLRTSFQSPLIIGLVLVTGLLTVGYVTVLRGHRDYLAVAAAGGLVFTMVTLLAGVMFPYVDRASRVTIQEGIVSTLSLNLMTIGAGVLLPVIFVYFGVLYSVFSGPIDVEETY